jgi:hypothetical protein
MSEDKQIYSKERGLGDREGFDADIARAKAALKIDPEDKQIYSKERGLGPSLAQRRLKDRGVDIRGLIGNRASESGEYKKGGKVSSASSRADGCAQRGKTKGTIVMCGGGMAK